MSEDQSGPTGTLQIAAVKPSPRLAMAISSYGLYYRPAEVKRI